MRLNRNIKRKKMIHKFFTLVAVIARKLTVRRNIVNVLIWGRVVVGSVDAQIV